MGARKTMNKKGQLVGMILASLGIICSIIGFTLLVNMGYKKECKMESEIMGVEWKYNFWIHCMINVDGKWIKMKNYIINKEDNLK